MEARKKWPLLTSKWFSQTSVNGGKGYVPSEKWQRINNYSVCWTLIFDATNPLIFIILNKCDYITKSWQLYHLCICQKLFFDKSTIFDATNPLIFFIFTNYDYITKSWHLYHWCPKLPINKSTIFDANPLIFVIIIQELWSNH